MERKGEGLTLLAKGLEGRGEERRGERKGREGGREGGRKEGRIKGRREGSLNSHSLPIMTLF